MNHQIGVFTQTFSLEGYTKWHHVVFTPDYGVTCIGMLTSNGCGELVARVLWNHRTEELSDELPGYSTELRLHGKTISMTSEQDIRAALLEACRPYKD